MGVFTHRTFSTEKPLHRTVFTHVFLHKKHLTQRKLYTQIAHRSFYRPTFLHAETSPGTGFTQQKIFRTQTLTHKNKYSQQFLHKNFYTESSPHRSLTHRSLTHRRFYAQHRTTYFYIQTVLHRCVCTDTNCTQKLVHTARVYTQPTFTQGNFVSPS